MTTYSIGAPPKTAGIYLLHHKPTKRKYVGQAVNLHKRWSEWRWCFAAGGAHARNKELFAAIAGTDANDWEFSVITEVVDQTRLDYLEQHVIQTLVKGAPHLMLNRRGRETPPVKGVAALPKTTLVDMKGRALQYRAASVVLGISHRAVVKKLAAMREQNIFKVKLCSRTKKLLPA